MKSGKRKFFTFFTLFLITGFLITLNFFGSLNPLKGFGQKLFSPFGREMQKIVSPVGNFFRAIGSISSLSQENKKLQSELSQALASLSSLKEAKIENESLKKQLNFNQTHSFELIPAQVIFYNPSDFSKTITINKGTSLGLKKGNAVLKEGSLIGRITDVFSDTAMVSLVIDPSFITGCLIGDNNISALAKGQIGYNLKLEEIPQDAVFKIGDLVVTSGLGEDFPKGLLIGRVEEIFKQDNAIFQSASLKPVTSFNYFDNVFVIK